MNLRRVGRLVYLAAFIAVQQFTGVFVQYPLLEFVAIVGVAIVGLDALVCAVRRWRAFDASSMDEETPTGE